MDRAVRNEVFFHRLSYVTREHVLQNHVRRFDPSIVVAGNDDRVIHEVRCPAAVLSEKRHGREIHLVRDRKG